MAHIWELAFLFSSLPEATVGSIKAINTKSAAFVVLNVVYFISAGALFFPIALVTAMKNVAAHLRSSMSPMHYMFITIFLLTSLARKSSGLLTKPEVLYGGWKPIVPGHPFYFGPVSHKRSHQPYFDEVSGYKFVEPSYRQAMTSISSHSHAVYPILNQNSAPTKTRKNIYTYYPPSTREPITQQIEYKPLYIELPRKPLEIFEKPKIASSYAHDPSSISHNLQEQTFIKITPLVHPEVQHTSYTNSPSSNPSLRDFPSNNDAMNSISVQGQGLSYFQEMPQQKIVIQPTFEIESPQQKQNSHQNLDSDFLLIPPGEILNKFQGSANLLPKTSSSFKPNHRFELQNLRGITKSKNFFPGTVPMSNEELRLHYQRAHSHNYRKFPPQNDHGGLITHLPLLPSQGTAPKAFFLSSSSNRSSNFQLPEKNTLIEQVIRAKHDLKKATINFGDHNEQNVHLMHHARSLGIPFILDNREGLYQGKAGKYGQNKQFPHSFENMNISPKIINNQQLISEHTTNLNIPYFDHKVRDIHNRNMFRGSILNVNEMIPHRSIDQGMVNVLKQKEITPILNSQQEFHSSPSLTSQSSHPNIILNPILISQTGQNLELIDQHKDSLVTASVQHSQHVNETLHQLPQKTPSKLNNQIPSTSDEMEFIEIPITTSYVAQNGAFSHDDQKEPLSHYLKTPNLNSFPFEEKERRSGQNKTWNGPNSDQWYAKTLSINTKEKDIAADAGEKSTPHSVQYPRSYYTDGELQNKDFTSSKGNAKAPITHATVKETGENLDSGYHDQNTHKRKSLNSTESDTSGPQLFHAYYAANDHKAPEGYVKMTLEEFNNIFGSAEIRYVDAENTNTHGTPTQNDAIKKETH